MNARPRSAVGAVVASLAVAAMSAGALTLPNASAAPQAGVGAFRASACSTAMPVAARALRTPRGAYLGRALITVDQTGGTYTVCAVVVVARPLRLASTLVTRNLLERSADGADLGGALSVARATRLSPVYQSSSFVPSGSTFVLKAKIDADRTATSTVRFLVP